MIQGKDRMEVEVQDIMFPEKVMKTRCIMTDKDFVFTLQNL